MSLDPLLDVCFLSSSFVKIPLSITGTSLKLNGANDDIGIG